MYEAAKMPLADRLAIVGSWQSKIVEVRSVPSISARVAQTTRY